MIKAVYVFLITYKYLKKYGKAVCIDGQARQSWAYEVFAVLGIKVKVTNFVPAEGPVILVANHIGYLDIPLLMATALDSVFVSKREILYWPMFGTISKKIGTIFVNRSCQNSRSHVRDEIERQLVLNKKKIVVFPAGTTSLYEERRWRKGVFEIAHKLQIPIQPVRLDYSNLRTVAYIGADFFPTHLLRLARKTDISATIEFHKPILISDIEKDFDYCRRWCSERDSDLNRSFTCKSVEVAVH